MRKRLLARIVAGLVLLLTGLSGLSRFPAEFRASETPLQRLAEIGVLGYGIAGTAAALALLLRRGWTLRAALAWAAAGTLTGTLAPVAFGGGPIRVGLAGGLATALVAGAVVWLVRFGLSPDGRSSTPSAR